MSTACSLLKFFESKLSVSVTIGMVISYPRTLRKFLKQRASYVALPAGGILRDTRKGFMQGQALKYSWAILSQKVKQTTSAILIGFSHYPHSSSKEVERSAMIWAADRIYSL